MTKEQYKREDFNIYDVIIFEDLDTSIEQACVNEIKKEKEVNKMVDVIECDLYAISLYENGYKVWKRNSVISPFYATDLKIKEVIDLKQVRQALTELQAITEAKPSEALDYLYNSKMFEYVGDETYFFQQYNVVKSAQLKAQEQEKVLNVIKKKCLHNDNLNYVAVCINYDMYKEKMSEKHDTVVVKTNWNDKVLLDCLNLLNQEEFELLKKWEEIINGQENNKTR